MSTTVPGGVVTYTLTLANTGQTPYVNTSATFTIAGFLDDATYNGDVVTSSGNLSVTPDGALLWTGDIAVGATVTIVGSVTVNDPDTGDRT